MGDPADAPQLQRSHRRETELAASLMAGDRRNLEEGPLSEPGDLWRFAVSCPVWIGYLRLNPGRPGASARISISPATRGRSTRCSTDPSGTLSGNGRETELAASLKDELSAENSVPQSGVSRGPTYRYRRWTRWCALTIGPWPEMRPSLTCHCSVGSAAG